jgi:hypothetical protein
MFCGPAEHGLEEVCRAGHATRAPIEHMRVDHRGLHITVAEQLLDRTDVGAPLQEVRGKAMAEGMATRWLADPCSAYSGMHHQAELCTSDSVVRTSAQASSWSGATSRIGAMPAVG